MTKRRKLFGGSSRLVAQIYVFGLATIVAVGFLTFSIASLMFKEGQGPGRPPRSSLARLLVGQIRTDSQSMPLRQAMERVRQEFNVDVSFYGTAGELLESTDHLHAAPRLSDAMHFAPPPDMREPPRKGPGGVFQVPLLGDGKPDDGPPPEIETIELEPGSPLGTHAVVSFKMLHPMREFHIDPGLLSLFSSLIVLAVTSFLLSRWLISPLKKVSKAVAAFGAGDFQARANLSRTDELGALGATFDQMADKISSLVTAQKELVANVSHELRTPISRIRVALDIAHLGDAASAASQLEGISADLFELEDLLESIIVSSRLDLASRSGTIPLRFLPSNPLDLLQEAATRFHLVHPNRTLHMDLRPALPMIEADAKLLRRVVDNLLQNAAKYSEAETPIALSASEEEGQLRVDVADQGIGIASEDLERVFEPFFRTDRSRNRATGGTGLGLTLARRVVEAHGGRIWITSTPGVGTKASFSIPLAARS